MRYREIVEADTEEGGPDDQDRYWRDFEAMVQAKIAASKPKRQRPETFKTGRFEDFFARVQNAGAAMFDADPEDFDRDDVKNWIATHRKLWAKGRVRVYRTVQVDTGWVEALASGTEVGAHWTFQLDPDVFRQFNIQIDNHSQPIVVLEADIDIRDADMPMSVAYNTHFPEENEIFLSPSARPIIVAVRRYDAAAHKVGTENLRPDLVGEYVRA